MLKLNFLNFEKNAALLRTAIFVCHDFLCIIYLTKTSWIKKFDLIKTKAIPKLKFNLT